MVIGTGEAQAGESGPNLLGLPPRAEPARPCRGRAHAVPSGSSGKNAFLHLAELLVLTFVNF